MVGLSVRGLAVLVVLLGSVLPLTFYCANAQEQESVTFYIVNPLTGTSFFKVDDRAVNSVFTADFYIGNVANLVAWQLRLSYNRTLIGYDAAWFPGDNVFEGAIESGATPLWEVSDNLNDATEMGDLVILMTCSNPAVNSVQYPVNVTVRGLLCEVNFTILSLAASTQLDFVSTSTSNALVSPLYFLSDHTTCVETISGTYPADGQPAVFYNGAQVPEVSVLLVLIMIPATLVVALTRKRTKRSRLCVKNVAR